MRAFKQETLRAQAGMLAFNCTGVLSFSDGAAAEKLLASLQSQPTVTLACLYGDDGKLLATYPAKPQWTPRRTLILPYTHDDTQASATVSQEGKA